MISAEKFAIAMHVELNRGLPIVPVWAEIPKEQRQRYIRAAAALLAGPLRAAPVLSSANADTWYRAPKRVQAYQYRGPDRPNPEGLNPLLRIENGQAFFNLVNEEGDFLMEEGIEPGQWLCVVTASGETYVLDDAEFRREYQPAGMV